jgi:innexin
MWEGGKIQSLMMGLNVGVCDEVEKNKKVKLLVDYLHNSKGHHGWYAGRYFSCELLAFINVVSQMVFLNDFFSGEFLTYGLEVLRFTQMDHEDRIDPMVRIFPKVTKCRFYQYGTSGNLETVDALCILPLNVINEKIYVFLWFWFLLLTILSAIVIVSRLIIIISPPVRIYLFQRRFPLSSIGHLRAIVNGSDLGDWFLFYMLGQNIDSVIFKEIIEELASKSGPQEPS